MKKIFLFILSLLINLILFSSCRKLNVNELYEQNAFDDSIIDVIRIIGEDKIEKIAKRNVPYEIPMSFGEIMNFYSTGELKYDSFLHLFYSRIYKKNYPSNLFSYMSGDKLCVFIPNKYNKEKGKVDFIFCTKDENEFRIFDITFASISEKAYEEIFEALLKKADF